MPTKHNLVVDYVALGVAEAGRPPSGATGGKGHRLGTLVHHGLFSALVSAQLHRPAPPLL